MLFPFFGIMLNALIHRDFESRRAFIRAAFPLAQDSQSEEDTWQGYVGHIIREGKPPALHYVENWANVLHLTGRVRELFIESAAIMHVPDERLRRQLFRKISSDISPGLLEREMEMTISEATRLLNAEVVQSLQESGPADPTDDELADKAADRVGDEAKRASRQKGPKKRHA